jgi:hemerythrin-like domain-containing protein
MIPQKYLGVIILLPISPLMIEHRVIERMIGIARLKLEEYKRTKEPNEKFVEALVDFIRIYADQNHHGKEEDILFRDLKKKKISTEHKRIMNELIQEHIIGRKTTSQLDAAKISYFSGEKEALNVILEGMDFLVTLYPKHIEKEDKHFFQPVMTYFSSEELDKMLREEHAFDRKMIHRKYGQIVRDFEDRMGVTSSMSKSWLDYL